MLKQPLPKTLLAIAALSLTSLTGIGAVYKEAGGIVCIDAIHYDYRNFEFTDAPIPHHFHIVPDEDGVTTPEHPWGDTHSPDFANSRTGKYLQILPDAGANNGNCPTCPNENVGFPPYAEFKVQITTVGVYQLYLRQVGWDGASDSFFAQILEFAPPGPGPNFYRYAPNPDTADFNALRNIPSDAATENQGWSGYAAPAPVVNGGDDNSEKPALYNITTPGLYSIRMSQREDGSGVDALILQLASLPAPTSPGPAESAISTTAPPYIRAVDPTPGQEQVPPDNNIGCQIVDGSTVAVNGSSIKMVVDGASVTPVITKTNNITYLSYKPSPLLPSGKAINWSVSFADNGTPAGSYSNSFPFKSLVYSPVPPSYAVPAGSVDTTKPGFLVRPYITDDANPDGPGAIAWCEDQLSGLHGPNNADLTGTNPQGYIEVTDVVNWDTANPPVADNFPFTADFPGAPGGTPAVNNLTEEVLTWLDLQPGVYRMVVNMDNGAQVSVGVDPRDKAGLVLGKIEGPGHTFGDLLLVFQIQTAGIYPFRLLYYNANDTGASCEWLAKNEFGRKSLINSSSNTAPLLIKAYRSGPSFPYVSRLSGSVYGFVVDFTDAPGAAVDPTSIQTKLNGASVTPNIGKTNGVTTIAYSSPALLPSGSTNTVDLTYTDSSGGGPKARSFNFVAPTYATLTPDYAVGAPDTSKPGFNVRVNQIDAGGTTVEPNTIAFAEQQLAGTVTNSATGQPYPNSATANTDGTFVYIEPNVINYDATGTGNNGTFTPDDQMPGFPGAGPTGGSDNAAAEILTYLTLPSGLITMAVASDDGFRVSSATNVTDPRNALTLGVFDGGRGVADTIFYFNVQQAGTYPMRLVWENGNGGANVEWFTINPDNSRVLVNDSTHATALKAYRAAAPGTPPVDKPNITSVALDAAKANITIQWSNGGTLESATVVTGPYNTTGNSSGSFSEPISGPGKFYRVKR